MQGMSKIFKIASIIIFLIIISLPVFFKTQDTMQFLFQNYVPFLLYRLVIYSFVVVLVCRIAKKLRQTKSKSESNFLILCVICLCSVLLNEIFLFNGLGK